MRLTRDQQDLVVAIWADLAATEEDISTERLFAMTCDRAGAEIGRNIDDGDVSEALERAQR